MTVASDRPAALAFIFVTVALDMLALGVALPVLPRLVLEFEGGDTVRAAAVYGAFGTVFAAMQFLFAPALGALSDRFGRRPVILLSSSALGLDYVLMAVAPTLAWLFVGRILSGICAASFSAPMAYVADVTPPERRAARFGLVSAAFGLGFILGPATGGLLGSLSPRLPFWVAAGLSLANTAYGLLVLPESLPRAARGRWEWRRANPVGALLALRGAPGVLGLAGVVFLSYVAHDSLPSTFVLYTDYRYGWTTRDVGWALAAVGVATAAVQGGLVGRIVRRLGERAALLFGLAAGVVGFALYGLAPTGPAFAATIPVVALWGVSGPAAQALMSQRIDPSEQGRLQGALAGVRSVGSMIGPVLFTGVFAAFIRADAPWHAPGMPFLLAAALLAAALAVAWRIAR